MGQVIQLILSSLKDVKTTLRAHHAAVQFRDQRLPDWFKLQEAVNAVILQRIGNRPLLLAEFGLAPKGERAQPSAEDKAIAAELRRRTRQVRGTMSKKQRLKITTRPEPTIQVLGPNGKPLLAPKLTPASPKLLGPHKPPKK